MHIVLDLTAAQKDISRWRRVYMNFLHLARESWSALKIEFDGDLFFDVLPPPPKKKNETTYHTVTLITLKSQIKILITAHDLYLIGFEIGDCHYVFSDEHIGVGRKVSVLDYHENMENYNALYGLARKELWDIKLGFDPLVSAIDNLAGGWYNSKRKLEVYADKFHSMIVVIQMIMEGVRFRLVEFVLIRNDSESMTSKREAEEMKKANNPEALEFEMKAELDSELWLALNCWLSMCGDIHTANKNFSDIDTKTRKEGLVDLIALHGQVAVVCSCDKAVESKEKMSNLKGRTDISMHRSLSKNRDGKMSASSSRR